MVRPEFPGHMLKLGFFLAACLSDGLLGNQLSPCMQGPLENVYSSALALGTANQLTNILRDVGEDVNERNRIYVPLEELDRFGISESEVCQPVYIGAHVLYSMVLFCSTAALHSRQGRLCHIRG